MARGRKQLKESERAVPHNNQYLVDVIGFNPTERAMLTSIFALAARRDPGFVQYDPVSGLTSRMLTGCEEGAGVFARVPAGRAGYYYEGPANLTTLRDVVQRGAEEGSADG